MGSKITWRLGATSPDDWSHSECWGCTGIVPAYKREIIRDRMIIGINCMHTVNLAYWHLASLHAQCTSVGTLWQWAEQWKHKSQPKFTHEAMARNTAENMHDLGRSRIQSTFWAGGPMVSTHLCGKHWPAISYTCSVYWYSEGASDLIRVIPSNKTTPFLDPPSGNIIKDQKTRGFRHIMVRWMPRYWQRVSDTRRRARCVFYDHPMDFRDSCNSEKEEAAKENGNNGPPKCQDILPCFACRYWSIEQGNLMRSKSSRHMMLLPAAVPIGRPYSPIVKPACLAGETCLRGAYFLNVHVLKWDI